MGELLDTWHRMSEIASYILFSFAFSFVEITCSSWYVRSVVRAITGIPKEGK